MKRTITVACLVALFLFAMPRVAAATNVTIQNNTTSYIDSMGFLHVVGEVQNTGDTWVQFVQITGTMKGSNGQVVDVVMSYTLLEYLPPGGKSPFDLVEADKAKSTAVTGANLVVSAQQSQSFPDNLVIQGASSSIDSTGIYEVVGQVNNNGQQASTFTKVIATFYDNAGKVIGAAVGYTSPAEIPTRQTCGFRVLGPSTPISGHIASFVLLAESNQYTSVAELPWTSLALVAVLSLVYVTTQRRHVGVKAS